MATPTKTAAKKPTTAAPAAKKTATTHVEKPTPVAAKKSAPPKGKEINLDDDDEDTSYSPPEMAEVMSPINQEVISTPEPVIDTVLASRLESHGTPEVAEQEVFTTQPSNDQTMDLPASFDLETNADGSQRLVLECFTVSCLTCTHLVSDGAKDWSKTKKCHTKDGNTACPSGAAKIVFVGLRNHYLNALNEARMSNDSSRVMRIMAKLEAEPHETRQYVLKKSGVLV
jgi:hypothetical protein